MGMVQTNGRPIETTPTPPGTPRWGAAWKKAVKDNYLTTILPATHGSCYSYRDSYLDLDPTYKDRFGRPLMRLTFDFHENELKMSQFLTDRLAEIVQRMGPRQIVKQPRTGHYNIVPYQTTHTCGGAIMGADPKTSALNRYLQSWDVPNLFVMGATAFPQNAGYNPTGTVAALTYWSLDAIHEPLPEKPRAAGACVKGAGRATRHARLRAAALRRHAAVRAQDRDQQSFQTIEHGRYMATAGDCAGCHTGPGGKPFAGGGALETPFGTLLAPNITPDVQTGIGGWTDDQFVDAVRDGTGRGGDPSLPGHALHLLYEDEARGRDCDPRLSRYGAARAQPRAREPAAVPVQSAGGDGRLECPVFQAGRARARSR